MEVGGGVRFLFDNSQRNNLMFVVRGGWCSCGPDVELSWLCWELEYIWRKRWSGDLSSYTGRGRASKGEFVRGAERPICTDPFLVSHGCCLAEGDAYARHHTRGVGEYP